MRCIFTNRTIEIKCFSIGTNRTIGTNGDPSYHHQHQWSLFVSIGQPSCYYKYVKQNKILLQQLNPSWYVVVQAMDFEASTSGFEARLRHLIQLPFSFIWKHCANILRYFINFGDRNPPYPAQGSNQGSNIPSGIVSFHMTSLRFKPKNYRSYRDFTFTMHQNS